MPTNLPEHPCETIKDLLREHWNPDNSSGLDPYTDPRTDGGLEIGRGWFDTHSYPLSIAVQMPGNTGEDVLDGGDAGYSGWDPSGAGGTQTRLGDPRIDIFAEGDREYGTDALEAEEIVFALRTECEDIIDAAAGQGSRDVPMPDAFESLSSVWRGNPNDTDPTPTVFRSVVEVTYSWERWP